MFELAFTKSKTEVKAAGPAINGMASGKIEISSKVFSLKTLLALSSLLNLLLSKSISIEIINKIIPPAILREFIDTPIQLKKNLPPYAKIINTVKAIRDDLIAILNLWSLVAPSVNNKNKGPIPAASIEQIKLQKN